MYMCVFTACRIDDEALDDGHSYTPKAIFSYLTRLMYRRYVGIVCVCMCACACVRACVCVRVRVHVHVYLFPYICVGTSKHVYYVCVWSDMCI